MSTDLADHVTRWHCRIDFVDRRHQYLAGEPYEVADPVKLERLRAARYIEPGAAPERKAKRAAVRRKELDAAKAPAPASAPAPAPAPKSASAGGR